MKYLYILTFSFLNFSFGFCQTLPNDIDISGSPNGVIDLPSNVNAAWKNGGITKYTKIQTPNGKAIHFVAQDQLTEAQIVRSRNILQFFLTNYEGSEFGTDKSSVANKMADNEAILLLLNGADGDGDPPNLPGQYLFQNEIAVEGHSWYINNNFNHRDAGFEEILHLMHDTGFGVDGPNSQPGALPNYQAEIRAAQDHADNDFAIWPIGESTNGGWYAELAQENSLSQEYLAAVVDSYYGLWGPWTEQTGFGMWGLYISQTREEMITEDPMGYALMPKYFSPFININMDIDPSFNGTFTMVLTPTEPYTHKSQYLQHVTLTGENNSGIIGNALYNRLNGNSANNKLEGQSGNDRIDGMDGEDTALFSGNFADYSIINNTEFTLVIDNIDGRDGVDTLVNTELIQFADMLVGTTVGATSLNFKDEATIYPSPARDRINLNFQEKDEWMNSTVLVIKENGNLVQKIDSVKSPLEINIDTLPQGIYSIIVINGNKMVSEQFLKI